jgi:plasmid stability protein
MADLVINNLNRTAQRSLRDRAEKHGRSVADEAREIIENSLARFAPADNLYDAIRADVAPLGGVEFRPLLRQVSSEPPFSDIDDEPNDGE